MFDTAEEYLGPNWHSVIRNAARSLQGNFDATKIPKLDEIIRASPLSAAWKVSPTARSHKKSSTSISPEPDWSIRTSQASRQDADRRGC